MEVKNIRGPVIGLDIGTPLLKALKIPLDMEVYSINLHVEMEDIVRVDIGYFIKSEELQAVLDKLSQYETVDITDTKTYFLMHGDNE